MRRPRETAAAMMVAGLIALPAPATSAAGWPSCWRDDGCTSLFLNVVTRQGDATLSVDQSCTASWRHVWGQRDARQTIVQWLDADAARTSGALCIPLHPDTDEIRIVSTGGHCGERGAPEIASASQPGGDALLQRSYGGAASVTLPGCHARIGNAETGEIAYGGVALDFADGYGFGDSYAAGYFYGVYDGFGRDGVRPFGASVYAISEFNTYHYRVEILARGRDDWTWGRTEDLDR